MILGHTQKNLTRIATHYLKKKMKQSKNEQKKTLK